MIMKHDKLIYPSSLCHLLLPANFCLNFDTSFFRVIKFNKIPKYICSDSKKMFINKYCKMNDKQTAVNSDHSCCF